MDLFQCVLKLSRKFPGILHKLSSFFRDPPAGFNQFFNLFGLVRHFHKIPVKTLKIETMESCRECSALTYWTEAGVTNHLRSVDEIAALLD